MAIWYRGLGLEAALDAIGQVWDNSWDTDDYRTLEKCARTFMAYIDKYPSEPFTIVGAPELPIVEQTFALETGWHCGCTNCGFWNEDPLLPSCLRCLTPLEPIEYGGILDTLISFSGTIYVLDHKSTSVVAPVKGGYFFDQFKPDNQMTGYIWAGSKLSGGKCAGAMVNAIAMNKSEVAFNRGITTRTEGDIHEWLISLRAHATQIMADKSRGVFPLRTVNCVGKYGKCQFHSVHTLSDPTDRVRRLEQDYIREPWDFERRDALPEAATSE